MEQFVAFATARQGGLLRAAYLLCGDRNGAEDLVQTTLLQLYRAWPRASQADSVDAYARRVLINSYLRNASRLRKEHDHRESTARLDLAAPEDDNTVLRALLLDALGQLGPRSRAIVILRYWQDLSVEV